MADIMSNGLTDTMDSLFYFWLAVWYLIILFHSWNIPVKDIISITIQSSLTLYENLPLVDLPTAPNSGPGNDIINIVSLELFILSFSILLFMGTVFFILWILRYALDPEGIIFKQYKRFQIMDKFGVNEVIPLGIPRFLMFITMIILILFEGVIGSIQNIFKLAFSFSSIIDYVYYIFVIVLGLLMLIFLIPVIIYDGKQIFGIISAVAGKINQFHKNYVDSKQSENPNIYLKNLIDKHKNGAILFCIIFSFMPLLREYKYGTVQLNFIILYVIFLIVAIVFPILIRKLREKKLLDIARFFHI